MSYSNIAHFIYKQKERNVKPYKLINFNGVWYLIATENSKIKNYAISKIINLRRGNNFKKNQDIENFIEKNSDQFISENLINIKLKVKKEVSEFILRRKIFKGQSAVRHLKNGDLVVEAKVAFLKDFMGMVRYWIPYISILEPIELKNKLLAELEDYIKKEKNVFEKYER
ncbi:MULTISPECIES: WYL domain-containing protein [unclassified Campylobacter]|uniref:WYL domain-containing protein n=1 Tax=unclassified Campylobacter TaxID=2593542 RepID=UPI0032D57BCB